MTTDTFQIKVLFPGFSVLKDNIMEANCSCTLIKGPINCIIDTMTSWDGPKLVEALKENCLSPSDINYVICTHGHSDHIGCNYLFRNAIHIVGFSISQRDKYFLSTDFSQGDEYKIFEGCSVVPTPGHTLQDVTVIFKNDKGVYAITGDLFEKEEDLSDESIWISAGSDSEELQRKNRQKILEIADFIVPGHGSMFRVPDHQKIPKK
ncbi:metallo-beta-lactamase domain-containing protein 1 [Anthonomus grandis grandis]|uniref:metallo-beta-lactamase domain-containing protein 1 n=1 Tax=Anthonomus grandis grandis TaxID=2921223 RepID=UPI002165FF56|nr:metallo-beta-lactamase domain-containing protein 1 [Anthonomus grandis grandis]